MSELPITRFVRWLVHKNDRPADRNACEMCEREVAQYEGEWNPAIKQLLCGDDDCYFEALELRA